MFLRVLQLFSLTRGISLSPKEFQIYLPRKTNMTMENPPFEDAFPIGHGGFSSVILVLQG